MIFSESRSTLFGIMLAARGATTKPPRIAPLVRFRRNRRDRACEYRQGLIWR
jgi:hypothetical protein